MTSIRFYPARALVAIIVTLLAFAAASAPAIAQDLAQENEALKADVAKLMPITYAVVAVLGFVFLTTLYLSLTAGIISLFLGILLAAMRVSPLSTLRWVSTAWVEVMRNTPLTLIFIFVASVLLTFTISFDEFLIAFFLSASEPTLPVYLWGQLRFPKKLPSALALGSLIIVASFIVVTIAELMRRRRTGWGTK